MAKDFKCTCLECGKIFYIWPSEIKFGKGKYCSRVCAALSKSNSITKVCIGCGKSFKVKPSDMAMGRGNYCSKKCRDSSHNLNLICDICGKLYKRRKANVRSNRHYCSQGCYWKAKRVTSTGSSNPMWRGGRRHYRGANWYQQRELAYKRDNGICQYCGVTKSSDNSKCNVHHIKPFRTFNGNYMEANLLSNLITLCKSCHKLAEHGKINLQPRLL